MHTSGSQWSYSKHGRQPSEGFPQRSSRLSKDELDAVGERGAGADPVHEPPLLPPIGPARRCKAPFAAALLRDRSRRAFDTVEDYETDSEEPPDGLPSLGQSSEPLGRAKGGPEGNSFKPT